MLAEEFVVVDADASLWRAARPLLDAVLRLEQYDESYCWHGWSKWQMGRFLNNLPEKCSFVVGVWETVAAEEGDTFGHESLVLGVVCEVDAGEVCSMRTFDALAEAGLKASRELEPGIEDALEIMRVVRAHIAPVAWALFTDKETWDEWLFGSGDNGEVIDKGELLAGFARQGHCVLMGSQTAHHHPSAFSPKLFGKEKGMQGHLSLRQGSPLHPFPKAVS